MGDLISVVVPVYNRRERMEECINSILRQTYEPLEVILVDDGSTDGSFERMQVLAAEHAQIHCFSQKNAGPSAARNTGMDKATGRWVCFIDSDDVIPADYIENMAHVVSTYGDDVIPVSGMQMQQKGESLEDFLSKVLAPANASDGMFGEVSDGAESSFKAEESAEVLELQDTCHFMELEMQGIFTSPCNKLYLRALLQAKNLRFNEEKRSAEDFQFNLDYIGLPELHKFAILPKNRYYYTQENQDRLSVLDDTRLALFEESQILLREKMDEMKSSSGDFRLWKIREDKWRMMLLAATMERRDIGIFQKIHFNSKLLRGPEFKELLKRNDLELTGSYRMVLGTGSYGLVHLYMKLSSLRR